VTAAAVLEDSHEAWAEEALNIVIGLSHIHHIFTADDLGRNIRKPPHPNLPGQAFSRARSLGLIEAVGFQTSTSKSRKNGVLRVWQRRINKGATS